MFLFTANITIKSTTVYFLLTYKSNLRNRMNIMIVTINDEIKYARKRVKQKKYNSIPAELLI